MDQNRQDIEEHLLLQYLQGNADEALIASVEAWLKADGRNRQHLDQLESLWLETGRISPAPVAVDVEAAWDTISRRINGGKEQDDKVRNLWKSRILWAAAASVLLIAGIFSIFKLTESPKQVQIASFDRVLNDSLPDGSKITLNRNSTLSYPARFDDKVREVKLSGEAYFEVKHDSLHPFVVDAGMAKIRVLGTTFRVNTHPDGVKDPDGVSDPDRVVEVTVIKGRVMLFRLDGKSGDTLSLILQEGENGIMKKGGLKPDRTDAINPDDLFWANHFLDFHRTTLSRVFSMLEKYYSVKISVSDPAILNCRLTASFMNEPIDKILKVIAESFGLKLEIKGQTFQLTGHGCSKEGD